MNEQVTFTSHNVDQNCTEPVENNAHMTTNRTLSHQFYTFASEATAHGVNRFGNRESGWLRRLLWLLLWLFMSALFLKVIIAGTIRYLSYPFIVHVTYENIHNHTFPDVTICNNNYLRKSVLQNDSFAKLFFETIDMTKPEELLAKPELTDWALNTDFISFFMKGAIPAEQFVCNCEIGMFPTQCPNMTQVITNRGVCHTLSGFVNNEGQPIINRLPGMDFGFKFNVDVHAHEDSSMRPSGGVGIIVMVHPSGVPPSMNTAFAVAPGTEQYLALQLTQTSRLGLPYNKECHSEKSYSQEKCRQDCIGEHVLEKCSCDLWGRMPSVVNCSVTKFQSCWKPAYDAVYDEDSDWDCTCPLPCEETSFNMEISNMKYPSDARVENISSCTGHSKEYMEKNIVAINLYFQSFLAQKVHEEPAYGLAEFAADAGGQMGLFLGASIISISEFLEFLLDLMLMRVNQRKMISPTASLK